MSERKTIYLIKVVNPETFGDQQQEWFAYDKGAFTNKDVAESVANGIKCFMEKGSPNYTRVVPFQLSETETFEEWMDENAPWRQKEAG